MVNGVAVVNPEKCTVCTMCVKECPKNLIRLVTLKSRQLYDATAKTKVTSTTKHVKWVHCMYEMRKSL
ncbi:MAG: 4Fe-4S binding protein [Acutalibacteraceae bacterium]